ncbi:MAG: glutathione S-transferase family protein [Caulobacteraceae bacterium]
MELIIGSKRWSSWSLRPWLVLKHANIGFDERLIPLRRHDTSPAVAALSPSGMIPVLRDGDLTIYDSLAICEYLAEKLPEAHLWPRDTKARALARCAAAEMHSGFASLRGECPMELVDPPREVELSEATHDNIRRIVRLCADLLARPERHGPFLFGEWSIADAFYTPVATRFVSYGVKLSDFGDQGEVAAYMEALLQTPAYKAWVEAAQAEA